MVTALSVLVVVLLLVLVLLAIELWSLPRRRYRVLVNLIGDDGTIDGVLWSKRGCWLVVKDARLLRINGEAVAIDGEALVDKARVAFIQVLQ